MKHSYTCACEDIVFRPLEERDIEQMRILRNSAREFFVHQEIISPDDQKKWFEHYLEKEDDIMFAIELANPQSEEQKGFIGTVGLYDIDWKEGSCELGRTMIDKEKAPFKGLGRQATFAMGYFGFEVLHFKTIRGTVMKNNPRILKSDYRAGFELLSDKDEVLYTLVMTPESFHKAQQNA